MKKQRILLTGVTGFIGGSLLPRLLDAGYPVRVLVRDAAQLTGRSWLNQVDVVEGDVLNRPETLPAAMNNVDVAYYFVHSLKAGHDFEDLDQIAARNFASAARAAGVQRIIFLGGLGDPADPLLSTHLRSRQETGDALREAGVPVTEFRAAIIIGSGSGSFEMIRYLTERIPLLVSPRWVFSQIQPIAIDDVLDYLVAVLNTPESSGQILEIGGPTILSYGETMMVYARARNLRRRILPVPVLSPSISSHWVGWVTPLSARIARPLIEGLRNHVVVTETRARDLFPQIQPMDYETAVRRALDDLGPDHLDTSWLDRQVEQSGAENTEKVLRQEGLYIQRIYRLVQAPQQAVCDVLAQLGGRRGWLYGTWLWRLRGLMDRLLSGIPLHRGRSDPNSLHVDDVLDVMRVMRFVPGRLLRLKADGEAFSRFWLQFEVKQRTDGRTWLIQTVFVDTKGLLGLFYWYLTYPIHAHLFGGLADRIAEKACNADHVNGRQVTRPATPREASL